MAIVKVMGLLDLLTVFFMVLYQLSMISGRLILSFAAYLFIKGFMFREDPASNLDFIIAIYLLFSVVFNPYWILTVICSIYLLQKGFFSLL